MRTWSVRENETVDCPGLDLGDIPASLPENVRVLARGEQLQVSAKNVAGVVPLVGDRRLLIRPKVEQIDPIEMLLYLVDSNSSNASSAKTPQYALGSGSASLDLLVEAFAAELLKSASKPKKFKRVPRKSSGNVATGHVDWASSHLRLLRGQRESIMSTRPQPTFNIAENKLLVAAARRALPLLDRAQPSTSVVAKWARNPRIDGPSHSEVRRIEQELRTGRYGGSHSYYQTALQLALVIVGAVGVTQGSDLQSESILFNMPGLYEDFVRTALMRAAAPTTLAVRKGFIGGSYLFTDGVFELIPDAVVYEGGQVRAVLDAKYKEPDAKDFYQLYTYMRYADLDRAVILSPWVEDGKIMDTFDGKHVELVRVATSAPEALTSTAERIIGRIT